MDRSGEPTVLPREASSRSSGEAVSWRSRPVRAVRAVLADAAKWLFVTRQRQWIVCGLVFAAFAAVGMLAVPRDAPPHKAAGPPLTVDPAVLDFGDAWAQNDFSVELPIQNRSAEEVTITGFRTSLCCVKFHPDRLTLRPLDTRVVQVIVDLRPSEKHAPSGSRPFVLSVSPRLGEDQSEDTVFWWDIRGRVKHPLSLDPPLVDFGNSLQRGLPFDERTVVVRNHYGLESLKARCDAAQSRVSVQSDVVGDTAKLVIKPAASLPDGGFDFLVNVQGTYSGQPLPPTYMRVRGTVLPVVRAEPERIEFGLCRAGTTVTETVILKSANGKPFDVIGVETESDNTVAMPNWPPGAQPASAERPYRITHELAAPGSTNSSVEFTTRTLDGRLERLKVSIHAHCLE